MNGNFEGDLVRPLGLVTLYWAYAEAQLDEVLGSLLRLSGSGPTRNVLLFGAKLQKAVALIEALNAERLSPLAAILDEAKALIEARNELIHGQLFNGGRLVLKTGTKYITAQEISDIAERIFSWKERLWVQHCRELLPMLEDTSAQSSGSSTGRSPGG